MSHRPNDSLPAPFEFCWWLQGLLDGGASLDAEPTKILIREGLARMFDAERIRRTTLVQTKDGDLRRLFEGAAKP